MLSMPGRVCSPVVLVVAATALGGCVTGTEVSYSEFQYDRQGGTERVYEHSLYADPSRGVETERCRTIVKRRIDAFGDEVVRRNRECDLPGQTSRNSYSGGPQDAYPGPVYPSPPLDVPRGYESEFDPR